MKNVIKVAFVFFLQSTQGQYVPFTYCQVEDGDTIALGLLVAGTGLYRKEQIPNAAIQKNFTVGKSNEPVFIPGFGLLIHARVAHPKIHPVVFDGIYRGYFHTRGISSFGSILIGEAPFLVGVTAGVVSTRVGRSGPNTVSSEIGTYEQKELFGGTLACMNKKLNVQILYEALLDKSFVRKERLECYKLFSWKKSQLACGFVFATDTGVTITYMHHRVFLKSEIYPSGHIRTETFVNVTCAVNVF